MRNKEEYRYLLIIQMEKYKKCDIIFKVYRFLKEDKAGIEEIINQENINDNVDFKVPVSNREDNADASPLELLFEKNFANVYGINAIKYLAKEHPIADNQGHHYFLDYFVRSNDGKIAVEENGVTYLMRMQYDF